MIRIRPRALILGLLAVVIALAGGAVVLLVTLDWRSRIESMASHALDRRVSIASLAIAWRNPLAVELTGLRIANANWGSQPDMLSIDRLSASIDVTALLRGVLRFETLRLEKPVLLLERDAAGVGNWHIGGGGSSAGGLAIVPRNRTQFPILLDFALHDGALTYRATQGDLRLDFHDLAISTAGDDQEVSLALDGAYNGVPTRLTATTQSYAVLRDAAVPFSANFAIANAGSTIAFQGTMSEPLDFEGVRGRLQIDAQTAGGFLRIFGADLHADFPLAVTGIFDRTGEHWHLSAATGRLARNAFDGTLALTEGERGAADALAADLGFSRLDLVPLVGNAGKSDPIPLRLDAKPGVTIDARIAAKELTYETRRLADFAIEARTGDGQVSVDALSFAFAGGKVTASGAAHAAAAGSRIALTAALAGADADRLAQSLDAAPRQLAGRLDGRLTLDMTGATLAAALKTSRGQAVLGMVGGRVARDLVERASTDLRALFRKGEGWARVSCLLGIAELRNGIATIAPLRLRTPETTLLGVGRADLAARRLDMTVKTQTGGTSVLALRLPLRISGDFDALSVAPSLGASAAGPEAAGDGDPGHLTTPELQLLAERNPCRH